VDGKSSCIWGNSSKRSGLPLLCLRESTKPGAVPIVSLPPALLEQLAPLAPLAAGRRGSELVFTSPSGGRIVHGTFWQKTWTPGVTAAHDSGLAMTPRIHDLRHTHASWLIHEGVPLLTITRRLGHASASTTEQVYGHLMPQALQDGADSVLGRDTFQSNSISVFRGVSGHRHIFSPNGRLAKGQIGQTFWFADAEAGRRPLRDVLLSGCVREVACGGSPG